MASRLEQYQAFVASNPSADELRAKVDSERERASRSLLLARLQYSYVDYNPWMIGKRLSEGQSAGDGEETSGSVTLRHGWVRWSELRTRIDAVDAWLKSPDPSRAKAVLREIMVDIPDTIDDQRDYLGKMKTYVGEGVKDALDTSSTVLIPLAVIATVFYLSGRR